MMELNDAPAKASHLRKTGISKANASDMGKLGAKARWQAYYARKLAFQIAMENPLPEPPQESLVAAKAEDDSRKLTVLRQIDLLDKDFENAEPELRVKIASAKDKLWGMVYPKISNIRPAPPKKSRSPGSPESYSPPEPAE
jgi:hypothetical protein